MKSSSRVLSSASPPSDVRSRCASWRSRRASVSAATETAPLASIRRRASPRLRSVSESCWPWMTMSSPAIERSASALLEAPSTALRRRPDAPDSRVRTTSRSPFMSKTAAARMSAAIAARVAEPSPPRQRSRAPRSSVLPAPVSPVRTLNPGPNSRRASSITPSPWAYSSNNWDLGMTLSKALVET